MSDNVKLKYCNNNISGAQAPESSFMLSDKHIGSCKPESSIYDLSIKKQKSGGKSLNLSMSQISFCKILNLVIALLRSNYRPNLFLQLTKTKLFLDCNLYRTYR